MITTTHVRQKILGMLELDVSGMVLYSHLEGVGRGNGSPPVDLRGINLFGEAAPFANAAELAGRIDLFRWGSAPSDSFDFICLYDDGPLPVRVLLARISDCDEQGGTKSILVHIRTKADAVPSIEGSRLGPE